MTDKERLGNLNPTIVDNQGNVTLKGDDYHWLMEQAEKAEKYREAINNIIAMLFRTSDEVYDAIQDAIKVLEETE